MGLFEAVLSIVALIVVSAVVSSAEISLAAARKLKLQNLSNDGDERAQLVLDLQQHPGRLLPLYKLV